MVEAIKGLQKKVKEMAHNVDEEDTSDEEEDDGKVCANNIKREREDISQAYVPARQCIYNDFDVEIDEEGNKVRHCYVLRGRFDPTTNTFFQGYCEPDEYMQQQDGCWKFVGLSTAHCKKLVLWISENYIKIQMENDSFFNEQRVFSKQWYAIKEESTGKAWIVPTSEEAETLTTKRTRIRKKYGNYEEAKEAIKGYSLQTH